jgi:Flp pilus assembly protein TadB
MTETKKTSLLNALKDEQGNWSAARLFLAIWLANAVVYTWMQWTTESLGVVLTFFTAIGTPLIVWTAGPRIAQYLGPSVGGVVQGMAESAKALAEKIKARRNEKDGYEVSK